MGLGGCLGGRRSRWRRRRSKGVFGCGDRGGGCMEVRYGSKGAHEEGAKEVLGIYPIAIPSLLAHKHRSTYSSTTVFGECMYRKHHYTLYQIKLNIPLSLSHTH